MFTCSVCCLLLFSLAVLTVGSLKCIKLAGQDIVGPSGCSVLQSSTSELGEECGAKDIAGLQACWEGAESSSPKPCCTVAELLAPFPGQPVPWQPQESFAEVIHWHTCVPKSVWLPSFQLWNWGCGSYHYWGFSHHQSYLHLFILLPLCSAVPWRVLFQSPGVQT